MYDFYKKLNLQLFADGGAAGASTASGGDGAAAAEGSQTGVTIPDAGGKHKGRKANPLANVQFGIEDTPHPSPSATPSPQGEGNGASRTPPPTVDHSDGGQKTSFDELIRGDYKKDFEAKVQEIVSKRLKGAKANEERLSKLAPVLEQLADRYNLQLADDGSVDPEALGKAVNADDEWMAQRASERGMSLETFKTIDALERDKARRDRQDAAAFEEQQRRAQFDKLVQQAEQAKQVYPGFDLAAEIENPAFVRLTSVGVDARTAYEVIHKDEIMSAGMAHAAQTAAQKVAASVQAGQRRPVENGLGNSSPAQVRVTDPRTLTKAQRKEIRHRVLEKGDRSIVW